MTTHPKREYTLEEMIEAAARLRRSWATVMTICDREDAAKVAADMLESLASQIAELKQIIDDGKRQWDQVAAILGADGDNVDDVIAKASQIAAQKSDNAQLQYALEQSEAKWIAVQKREGYPNEDHGCVYQNGDGKCQECEDLATKNAGQNKWSPHPWSYRKMGKHFAIEASNGVRVATVPFIGRPDGTTSEDDAKAIVSASVLPSMNDAMRDFIEGMSVSVDVSTGDSDAGNRYFGTISEVMDCESDKHGVTLLVYDAEPNFKANQPPSPDQDREVSP